MTAKPAVNVVIAGDTKGLEKSLKSSSKGMSSFGKTAAGVFAGLGIAKGIGLLVDGVQAVAGFATGGIDKLDAMGDSMARLDTLAKGLGKTATQADLTRFGVDKNEAAQSALAIAKTGKALGLTGKQLRKATPDLVEMSAKLASLGDGDPAKQAELLAKALGGSSKAAKALGIVLPKGQTGMKAYASLMAQLAPKLDKATDGQASLADVGERWDAQMSNLQISLAGMLDKLAPVISQLMDVLMPALDKLVAVVGPAVADMFAGLSGALKGFVEGGGAGQVADLFAGLMDTFHRIATFVGDNVVPVLLDLAGAVGDTLRPLIPKLQQVFDDLMPVLETVWGFIGDVVVPLIENIVLPAIGAILDVVLDVTDAFLKNLKPALTTIGDVFQDLMDFMQPVFDMLNDLAGLAGDVIGSIGSIHIPGINMAPAPAAASSSAGTFAASPITVNVQAGVGDPVAIGRTVARYLGAYTGRGGRP